MSRFMRNGFMASMGAIIAVGLGISFWQDASGALSDIRRELGLGGRDGPVLVIFVGSPRAVAHVRAAVAPDRIVAQSPNAFALREGRIVAAGFEAAGDIVSAAGWVDRELTLMRVRRKQVLTKTASVATGGGELSPEKLAELLSQDTLTQWEASQLLDHI